MTEPLDVLEAAFRRESGVPASETRVLAQQALYALKDAGFYVLKEGHAIVDGDWWRVVGDRASDGLLLFDRVAEVGTS